MGRSFFMPKKHLNFTKKQIENYPIFCIFN
jgi:hypothetical protein